MNRQFLLFRELLRRDLRSRFVGTATGWLWWIVTPLLQLTVYALVFGVIFSARVPEGLTVPFVAWLAIALWPWLAFSDGVLRGAQSIREHAALIAKVAVPRHLLVMVGCSAAFLLHLVGFIVVLLVLGLTVDLPLLQAGWPLLLLSLLLLYLFALGLALGLGALQIYIRDLEPLLPTLFMFWFFLTPILYAEQLLPENMAWWMQFNPMAGFMDATRSAMLQGQSWPDPGAALLMLACPVLAMGLGWALFSRLSPHFEDFL